MLNSLTSASLIVAGLWLTTGPQEAVLVVKTPPSRTELIVPERIATMDREGEVPARKLGGHPRRVDGLLVFDGADDGNRQVDPQIAVGGEHVLTATNGGLIVYDKAGEYVLGVHQLAFRNGIDPKVFFDRHNGVFGFDLWVYWDEAKRKPVNISISETDDPTGAWNTYSIDAPGGVDGGAIGSSQFWTGYSFPGGKEQTFVLPTASMKAGKPTTAYHFEGNLGHPVLCQDPVNPLYFLKVTQEEFIVNVVELDFEVVIDPRDTGVDQGLSATWRQVGATAHGLEFVGFPPKSPQKGTDQLTSSGDRRPKNVVLQGGFLWFSHTVNCRGRAAVQWHQIRLDGSIVQTGLIASETSSYIQTSLAVNKNLDLLVGFQETSPDQFISPRVAWRRSGDKPGTLRPVVSLGEGQGATDGVAWGDYSGSCVDGDNLLDLWTVQSITDKDGKGDTVIARVLLED
ncbi:hypothetical protein Poly30_41750 [Planctomycetes bacterium Poly30]|uniref:Uncharacterized protein n=1 Tax=Saltatorellus ferox TaxID=2528018 RepID=A0A518EWZ5_9BACT|nr:hypothetical protein Poly30_41750 [Planctomycetes bacterium Poly30]